MRLWLPAPISAGSLRRCSHECCDCKKICKEHNCKAKVFTQMPAKLGNQIGSPDLIILFTNTVSHKMVRCAVAEAERCNADVVRSHTSSGSALTEILERVCG